MAPGTLNLLQGLGAATLFVLVGYGVVGRSDALRQGGYLVRAAYSYLLGVVVVGAALWAASFLVGMPLSRPWVTGLWLALAVAGGVTGACGAARVSRSAAAESGSRALRGLVVGVALLGALLSAAALGRAATRSLEDWDGRMTWAAHARYIRQAQTVNAPALLEGRWLVSHPDYPLLMPLMQVAGLELWGTTDERAMRPLYALFLPVLLLVAWERCRQLGGVLPAAITVGLAAGLPMLVAERHGGAPSAYSDLPLACLWGGGLLLLVGGRGAAPAAVPAGVLLAGAVLTKNEGAPLALIALVAAALVRPDATQAAPRTERRTQWRRLLGAASLPLAAWLLLRSWAAGVDRRYTEDYLGGLTGERLANAPERLPAIAAQILEGFIDPSVWLGFWLLFPLLLVAGAGYLKGSRARALVLAIAGAVTLYCLAYLATPWSDVAEHVRVTWHRFLMHLLLPLLALTSMALRRLVQPPRQGALEPPSPRDEAARPRQGSGGW